MKHLVSFTLFMILSHFSFGQTTLLFEDFEDATVGYTLSHPEASDGQSDYWIRTNGTNISPTVELDNEQGSYFFGAQDLDANDVGDDDPNISSDIGIMTFPNIDISTFTDLQFSIFIAEDYNGTIENWDGNSQFKVEYSIDGGTLTEIFRIEAAGGTNTEPKVDTDFDGIGDGTAITNAFQQFSANISGTGSSLELVITISHLSDGEEDIAFDEVKITGISPTTVAVGFENESSNEIEGNTGSLTHQVNIVMNNAPASNVTVEVTDAGTGTATAGAANDYEFTTTNLVFTTGESYPATKTVDITINGDTEVENNETINLSLAVTAGTAATTITNHTVTINNDDIYELVINEIFADPGTSASGDANGDGATNNDDEFIEFINNGASNLDISGFTISDAIEVRHTFPANTVVPPGLSIVVFGGGTPSGIPGLVQTASTGELSLNNSSETLTLKDVNLTLVEYTYGSEAGNNESIARNPDITGDFVQHMDITSNIVYFSPGRDNTDNSPLPVELLSFRASTENNKVFLSWETAFEYDNKGFEIEWSLDNQLWEKIGFVVGMKESFIPRNYQFTHHAPVKGNNFYRLKQIDFDGNYDFSNIQIARMEDDLSKNDFEVIPNPVSGNSFMLKISENNQAENIGMSLYNYAGQLVRQSELNDLQNEINVSDIESGMYLVHLKMNGENYWKRIVIQ